MNPEPLNACERSIIHLNIADFAVAVERALDDRLRDRPVIIAPEFKHFGSATIRSDPKMLAANSRSYPQNVKYYQEKWGGLMGRETFETPFDQGGSPRDCPPLDFDRLRALSWD